MVAYKCEQATYTRDAMAKALYGALFDWIVEQVRGWEGCGRGVGRCESVNMCEVCRCVWCVNVCRCVCGMQMEK